MTLQSGVGFFYQKGVAANLAATPFELATYNKRLLATREQRLLATWEQRLLATWEQRAFAAAEATLQVAFGCRDATFSGFRFRSCLFLFLAPVDSFQ